jgi:uncharacterized protein YbjT (DUF2867 family)
MRLAGSKAAFRAVDLDMVIAFAGAAHEAGAWHMLSISSVGADPNASSFYLRTKGELEQRLSVLGFERLDILRPGLLKGHRGGPVRFGERLAALLSPVADLMLRGALNRFAAIDAEAVAAAAACCLRKSEPGIHVHHNNDLQRLATALQR